jgi:hypothetical protein
MKSSQLINLLKIGAKDRVRATLKKYAMPERLKILSELKEFALSDKKYFMFFKDHFSVELGAIIAADGDLNRALEIYSKLK